MRDTRAKLFLGLLIAALAVGSFACNRGPEDAPAAEDRTAREEGTGAPGEEVPGEETTDDEYYTEDTGASAVDIEDPAGDTLADREAELAARERELARREADLAQRDAAPAPAPSAPAAPSEQEWREREPAPAPTPVTVPAGTSFSVELASTLSSETSQVGDRFSARLASPLSVGGQEAAPAGSTVEGRVTEAKALKKIGGRARLALAFDRVVLPDGTSAPLAASLTQVGKSETKKDAATIGGSAAAGAILGRVIGGGSKSRRSAIGAAAGAAIGTAVAAKTEGETVQLPAGTVLTLALEAPLTVTR